MLTTSSGMLRSQAVDFQSCWGIQTQGPTEGERLGNRCVQQRDTCVLALEHAVAFLCVTQELSLSQFHGADYSPK